MLLKDMETAYGLNKTKHCIFYVSDMEELPSSGHFRKMDEARGIIEQIKKGLGNCTVRKYAEYGGEIIDAETIGLVFPAHTWGISLAVLTFLQHLRFRRGAYIYAVCVGESVSADSASVMKKKLKLLEQFTQIFEKRSAGHASDIFVRCRDIKRSVVTTEEILRNRDIASDARHEISTVLEGVLYHSTDALTGTESSAPKARVISEEDADAMYRSLVPRARRRMRESGDGVMRDRRFGETRYTTLAGYGSSHETRPAQSVISKDRDYVGRNIYLDDDVFAGVKLCRVM